MEKCPRTCQAPRHERNCPCQSCYKRSDTCKNATDDHFTPQCVEKLARIKDTPENHQWLSRVCHYAKDADTPLRKQVLLYEDKIFTGHTGGENLAISMKIFEQGHLPEGIEQIFRKKTKRKRGYRRK